jgi:hypothetical protein
VFPIAVYRSSALNGNRAFWPMALFHHFFGGSHCGNAATATDTEFVPASQRVAKALSGSGRFRTRLSPGATALGRNGKSAWQ